MNKEIKLIIDTDELWVTYTELGDRKKKPVGNYAVITNKGIILQNGAILYNGTYISDDSDLPNVDDEYGEIRLFKELIGNCKGQESLPTFEFKFNDILSKQYSVNSWNILNYWLNRTFDGKWLMTQRKFKINYIINLERYGYGISYNENKKKSLGRKGYIYSINNSSLILDINGNIKLL